MWTSPAGGPAGGLAPLLWFVGTALAAATAWSLTLGRGPLERLVGDICRRAATAADER